MTEKLVDGFHVYGASASAKFEIVANRGGVFVLAVDIAGRVPSRDSFDWENKIAIQVTDREMPQLMCAVLGITPTFDLRNHGPKKNKSLSLANQSDKGVLYLRVTEGQVGHSIPISADKVFHLGVIGMKVLSLQTRADTQTCLLLLRGTTGRLLHGLQ
ncbi:hypothetical protein OU5_P0358 (plasmid) [Pseudomonas mandelii JR-1]|uniref:Uncharacterized protein n=1 Tax=Pseudomonas mandelii JR-1 TaxID=1147786 RepID=A0A024EM00_9PSED|nr:hypothetical protein [Pseudomonas mandelii]AHZ73610.1 hypothetical protein OU5_P0358 [Pseudomonas mandelii JR-1]